VEALKDGSEHDVHDRVHDREISHSKAEPPVGDHFFHPTLPLSAVFDDECKHRRSVVVQPLAFHHLDDKGGEEGG